MTYNPQQFVVLKTP